MKLLELLKESKENPAKPPFVVPELPFAEDSMESFANAETMRLHRTVHQQAYADGLNEAVKMFPVLKAKTPLQMFDMYRQNELVGEARRAVARFAGGFVNHSLFWNMLSPKPTRPSRKLLAAIDSNFGSMADMQEVFESVATDVFGSGWTWLIYEPDSGAMNVIQTSDQMNPAMSRNSSIILLGLDLWEHAFYLTHRADRKAYMKAFWKVANWDHASKVHAGAAR